MRWAMCVGEVRHTLPRARSAETGLFRGHRLGGGDGEVHRLEAEPGIEAGAEPFEPQRDQAGDALRAALRPRQADLQGPNRPSTGAG